MAVDDTSPGRRPDPAAPPHRRRDRSPWNWLILVPLVVSLTVPLFDRSRPSLVGIPFFYWYQMAAIAVGVICTIAVFRAHERAAERTIAARPSTER